ncbi:glycosyltransferase family 4 protein [Spirosoma soli]|uniref:Glycosyltransferase family 4 protein n=1 Tax=Spirosoma soli TaxID=1770529 RepID=A0ABW5M8F5_9BACT
MKVTFFFRKPIPSFHFSIERIFDDIKDSLGKDVLLTRKTVPFFCHSRINILKNIIWSSKEQDEINHITGDIHYIALGLQKKKTILTIHDINFLKRRHPIKVLEYYLLWLLLPLIKSKVITVVSEETKKDILKRVPFSEGKIRVIPNFYDPRYKAFPKIFSKEKPVLLQIGTRKNKNVERLIEAITGINCLLIIVGKYEAHLEQMLKDRNIDYDWKENLSDSEVMDQYRRADILCFVSTVEGFGMPILEAQAVGRAVITSNVSSMPEVAGDSALLVDPFNVEEIRKAISKLIDNDHLRSELIQKGFENIKRYEIKKIAGMYRDLYQEVYSQP